MLTHSPKELGL